MRFSVGREPPGRGGLHSGKLAPALEECCYILKGKQMLIVF